MNRERQTGTNDNKKRKRRRKKENNSWKMDKLIEKENNDENE